MYITLKRNSNLEYRLYLTEPETNEQVIFKGHKLSIDHKTLDEVIQYQYEVSTGNIFLPRYDVWLEKYENSKINNTNTDAWRIGKESLNKELMSTWSDLISYIVKNKGAFKNIWITKNYI